MIDSREGMMRNLFQLIQKHRLLAILILAVILRLLAVLFLNPNLSGGDTEFYLTYGPQLVRNVAPRMAPAPVYLLYVGVIQIIFSSDFLTTVRIICLLNIVWQVLIISATYTIGLRYFSRPISEIAAFIIAINPIFIIECVLPTTENVFMGLLFAALAIYAIHQSAPTIRIMALLGILFGLATLTRAVLLLFPVIIAFHVVWSNKWRKGLAIVGVFILTYTITVSTWTVYNYLKWDRIVIGAEGLVDFTWMGIHGQQSPQAVSQQAGNPKNGEELNHSLATQVWDVLTHNIPGYIATRAKNLLDAYIQPHNTVFFPGASLKDKLSQWITTNRTVNGLLAITYADEFWPKFALYLFHFWALIFGIVGMILYRSQFWRLLPLYGYVLYTTAVHSVLLALPRYLFPIQPILILFATLATVAVVQLSTTRYRRLALRPTHES
jgi:4-amino-4-deoxy-L-arabinose transferase-like glycosyltransferase